MKRYSEISIALLIVITGAVLSESATDSQPTLIIPSDKRVENCRITSQVVILSDKPVAVLVYDCSGSEILKEPRNVRR